jgi:hypothetical protein
MRHTVFCTFPCLLTIAHSTAQTILPNPLWLHRAEILLVMTHLTRPSVACCAVVSFLTSHIFAFFFIFYSGNTFQRSCRVSIVDTGARAAVESCSSSFEGEADGVVNELYMRHTWSLLNHSDILSNQPQIFQRLFHAAHASTFQGGIIMGPSYWDTPAAQVLMEDSRVHCAGGGGPCPALVSGWVLGAARWNQNVDNTLVKNNFHFHTFV